jgi:hypothetical protein
MDSFAYGPARKKRRHWPRSRRSRVLGAIFGFALFASAGALAQWLVNGSGSGFAEGGVLTAPTTQALSGVDVQGDLFPGSNGSITIRANNPNNVDLFITAAQPGAVTSGSQSNCPATNVTGIPKTGINIGPFLAGTVTTKTIPNAVSMASNAPSLCQGVLFEITYAASALTWSTAP